MDRREFSVGMPALLAMGSVMTAKADAQTQSGPIPLKLLASGVFKPGQSKAGQEGHTSQAFLTGMLIAGNLRLEMHESVQQPGAPHEAVGRISTTKYGALRAESRRCLSTGPSTRWKPVRLGWSAPGSAFGLPMLERRSWPIS